MAIETEPMVRFDNTEGLMQILATSFMLNEMQQINLLVGQMKEMENNYLSVLQELTEIRTQLDTLTRGIQPSAKNSISQAVEQIAESVEQKVAEQHQNLQSIGRHLESKAKQVVHEFRDIGILALNNVTKILGIQEKLIVMRDNVRSNEMTMKASIEKINKVESELSATAFHAKNVLKGIVGKEISSSPEKKKNKFFELLKAPYLKLQQKYTKRVEKLNNSIEKYNSLEKEANEIKIGREAKQFSSKDASTLRQYDKSSVREKLEQNKEIIAKKNKDDSQKERTEKQHDDVVR